MADSEGSHRKDETETEQRAHALYLSCLTYQNDQILEQKTDAILRRADSFLKYILEGTSS